MRAQFNAGVEKRREKPGQISHVIRGTGVISASASLVPRPPPSSVRNARAQFNAGVEKRREKVALALASFPGLLPPPCAMRARAI